MNNKLHLFTCISSFLLLVHCTQPERNNVFDPKGGNYVGEDSVQSGGEISLDSSTIIMTFEDDFRVLYSSGLFGPGGLVRDFLPGVAKEVVGIRDI